MKKAVFTLASALILIIIFFNIKLAKNVTAADTIMQQGFRRMQIDIAAKKISAALYAEEREADISGCKINSCELRRIQRSLRYKNPDFFNVAAEYKIGFGSDGYIKKVRLYYHEKRADAREKIDIYNKEADEILRRAKKYTDDLQKVIAVHDYICGVYEFDKRYYDKEYEVRKITVCDCVNMAVQKRGVCEGYAEMFHDCMTRLGIESDVAFNSNHVWNVVKLGGSWYHIDLTWDDKTPDCYARVFHDNMLKSDKALSKKHRPWYSSMRCRSTLYDNAPWVNAYSPIAMRGDKMYMVMWKKNTLMCFDISRHKLNKIYEIDKASHSGLGTYGDKLYFNTSKNIISIDIDKPKKTNVVYTDKGGDIISLRIDEGKISCAKGSYEKRSEKKIELTL